MPSPMGMSCLWRALVEWILIATVSILCYVNSCWGGFVFDDNEAILSNRDVTLNSSIVDVFNNDFWGTNIFHNNSHKSYRPLTVLTFRLNYWFTGDLNPFIFHLTNVIVHTVVCILYYQVCRHLCEHFQNSNEARIYNWSLIPLLASLMFAVHPVHTESVRKLFSHRRGIHSFPILTGCGNSRKSWFNVSSLLPICFPLLCQ